MTRRFIFLLTALLIGILPLCSKNIQAPRYPKLWTVHIDEVDPALAPDFELWCTLQSSARAKILNDYHIAFKPSYEISTKDNRYLTFRPRDNYAEFDKRAAYPDSINKLLAAQSYFYDDSIHGTLRTHYNQVWVYDSSSSYIPEKPTGAMLNPGFIHIENETVYPGKEKEYDSLIGKFNAALAKIHYPGPCLVFYSMYGDAANHFCWFAHSKNDFDKAGRRREILEKAYGSDTAENLMQLWKQCLVKSDDVEAMPRREINSLEEKENWFGYEY